MREKIKCWLKCKKVDSMGEKRGQSRLDMLPRIDKATACRLKET